MEERCRHLRKCNILEEYTSFSLYETVKLEYIYVDSRYLFFPHRNYDAYKEKLICQGEEVLKAFIPKMVLIWEQLGFPLTKIEEKIHAVLFHHQVTSRNHSNL